MEVEKGNWAKRDLWDPPLKVCRRIALFDYVDVFVAFALRILEEAASSDWRHESLQGFRV